MNAIRWSGIPGVLLGVFLSLTNLQAGNTVSLSAIGRTLPSPVVQFKVKVMGILYVTGHFRDVSGRIVHSAAEGGFRADIAVDVKSVNTDDSVRDHLLRSAAFFDVDRFPMIRYEGVRLASDAIGGPQLVGDLTLHGKTRRVAFDVVRLPESNCKQAAVTGCYAARATIHRSEFGLDGFRMIASDKVEITVCIEDEILHLLANPAGSCQQCGAHLTDRSFESAPYARNF
jgi:polyisoprenoid-binding protein YceI